jgi:hypothetical protein
MIALLDAATTAAFAHPIAAINIVNACVDMAFKTRLDILTRRTDSVGEAARALLEQIKSADNSPSPEPR